MRAERSTVGGIAESYDPHDYLNLTPPVVTVMYDSFIHPSGYTGRDGGSWSGSYDEESGRGHAPPPPPLMGPSWAYKVPTSGRGLAAEGHVIYDDDSCGTWRQRRHNLTTGEVNLGSENLEWLQDRQKVTYMPDLSSFCNTYAAPVLSPSAFHEAVSYSDIPKSDSSTKAYTSFASNHDKYMARPDSCFANPSDFYLTSTYPTLSHPQPPQIAITNVGTDQTLKTENPIVHVSTIKVDEAANSTSKGKEVKINKSCGSSWANVAQYREDHDLEKGVGASANFGEGFSSRERTSGKSSLASVELNSKLKSKGLTITISPAKNGSVEPDDSIKSSSEALDQLNLAVDSPCWKGAPTSKKPSLPVSETVAMEVSVKDPSSCNGLKQHKKDFENALNSSAKIVELGTSSADESNANASSETHDSLVNLLGLLQESQDDNKRLDNAKDENRHRFAIGGNQKEHPNEDWVGKKQETEPKDTGNTEFAPTEKTATNNILRADVKDDGPSLLSREKKLIKELHSASVDLLCNDYNNGIKLDGHDLKLLCSAVNNILLVLEGDKGFTMSGNHGGLLQSAWFPSIGLKADGINQRNIVCNMTENMRTLEFNIRNSGGGGENFVYVGDNADRRKMDMKTQAFGNEILQALSVREESAQSRLYKNLWLESEAEKCKLKYDLQETQMKFEIENLKHQSSGEALGESALLTTSFSPRSTHGIDGHDTSLKNRELMLSSLSCQLSDAGERKGKTPSESLMAKQPHTEDIEDNGASVMARFNILKDRKDRESSRSMDAPQSVTNVMVHGPRVDGENDYLRKDLGSYLADLGFMESLSVSDAIGMLEDSSSSLMPRSNMHPDGSRYINELDPGIDASGIADAEEFLFNPADQSLRNGTKKQGHWYPVNACRSSYSEWEHVQKE